MPSFDVVSKVNQSEVDNALNQTEKELGTRYDFRGTNTSIERLPEGIVLMANSDNRLEAALEVFYGKCAKRGVSLKHLEPEDPAPAAKGLRRQLIKIKEGIDRDNARKVIDLVKESKLKVQAAIQEDTVRITGKSKDDLQAVMRLLRAQDLPFEAQYTNFRD